MEQLENAAYSPAAIPSGAWGCLVSDGEQAAEAKALGAAWMVASHANRIAKGPAAVVGLLPFADANGIVLERGKEIVQAAAPVPVLAGILACDQFRRTEMLLRQTRDVGYAGVQTFPSAGILDGGLRELLESAGLGWEKELDAIRQAVKMGLCASGVAFVRGQAGDLSRAGARLVTVHLPLLDAGGHDEWNPDNRSLVIDALGEVGDKTIIAAFVPDTGRPAGRTLSDAGVRLQYETTACARLNRKR